MSQTACPSVRSRPPKLLARREETGTGSAGGPGRKGAMMMMMVIMRQRRTVMKDVEAIMVMRMTAILVSLMIKIHAVCADDIDDADGRTERYCDVVGFFRVT